MTILYDTLEKAEIRFTNGDGVRLWKPGAESDLAKAKNKRPKAGRLDA